MKTRYALGLFLMAALVGGCASLRVSTDFQAGRNALITGKSEVALSYFQSVAEKDPEYRYGTAYRQGVLSYLAAPNMPSASCRKRRRHLSVRSPPTARKI